MRVPHFPTLHTVEILRVYEITMSRNGMSRKSRALSVVLVLLGVLLLGLVAACSGAEPAEPQIVEYKKRSSSKKR